MIPYEELCAALDRWRQANGPPPNRARAQTTPAPVAPPPSAAPAAPPGKDSLAAMARRSGPIPIQATPAQQSGRMMAAAVPAPTVGRRTEPVAIAPPPAGALTPAPLPPPPEPEPLPPVWTDTTDSTIDEPSLQEATLVGQGPAGLAPVPQETYDPATGELDVDSIDVIDENDS
jgi:hypothetical protein